MQQQYCVEHTNYTGCCNAVIGSMLLRATAALSKPAHQQLLLLQCCNCMSCASYRGCAESLQHVCANSARKTRTACADKAHSTELCTLLLSRLSGIPKEANCYCGNTSSTTAAVAMQNGAQHLLLVVAAASALASASEINCCCSTNTARYTACCIEHRAAVQAARLCAKQRQYYVLWRDDMQHKQC
eukprot:21406-Heterococcus_DN1.PRE.1